MDWKPAASPRGTRADLAAQASLVAMGKRLFLLRHAKSSWDDPTLADHDRPLASRGRRASRAISDHLRRERIAPTLVLCSSSTRTRETLERIAVGFDDEVDVRIEPGLYMASARDLLERLREVGGDVESVMVIGHQPAIQELALSLARGGAQVERLRGKFPTAALATLAFRGSWGGLAPGVAELVAFVKPRELERRQTPPSE
jgi:phosphohistidine phosphatase